ncbi:MAG TPA: hypothetical protein VKS01_07600 [Bryobacteraceae bacterium]|nr:hypothetical protein [Bryobacteraceae bacterium]
MRYVALASIEQHIDRVKRRAARGGHSASETTLRRIHAASLANLPLALDPIKSGIGSMRAYDNSMDEREPVLVLEARNGAITRLALDFPAWLQSALDWSNAELERRRVRIRNSASRKTL